MDAPNVLLLDEPTNDFDIETLTALEDLLDTFAGTLIVISHDRYFLERVCNRFVGLLGDGSARDLPGGVDQYLQLRRMSGVDETVVEVKQEKGNSAQARELKKEIAKLERQLEKAIAEEQALAAAQVAAATDHQKLGDVMIQLAAAIARRQQIEEDWLEASSLFELHSQPR
jgi:ATP-binding cassette subfamily F protein uup